jgi:hypothetical protein
MSKNFEVLLRAERQSELFGSAVVDREIVETKPTRTRPQIHVDQSVHNEEVKLIERVFLFPGQHAPRVVVFCGIERSGGTAEICARAGRNLAEQTGMPVCLVDANLNSPSSLNDYFGIDNALTMTGGIPQSASIREFAQRINGENLFLVSRGRIVGLGEPAWKSDAWPSGLNELRRAFTYVLIAAPPVSSRPDTVLLSKGADGVILVLESQLTRREKARAIKQSLVEANVQLLGAVLNNHAYPIPDKLYKMV